MTITLFLAARDGHIFAVRPLPFGVILVTNENGCQTQISRDYAVKLLGGDFKTILFS